jgi:hypothetical protein
MEIRNNSFAKYMSLVGSHSTLSSASGILCATNCCYRPLHLSQIVHTDRIYSLHYALLKMCSNFTHSFWICVWHQISVSPLIRRFLGPCANLRKTIVGFVMSVYLSVGLSAWNNSAPTGRIFIKFNIWRFFRKNVEKISFFKIRQK